MAASDTTHLSDEDCIVPGSLGLVLQPDGKTVHLCYTTPSGQKKSRLITPENFNEWNYLYSYAELAALGLSHEELEKYPVPPPRRPGTPPPPRAHYEIDDGRVFKIIRETRRQITKDVSNYEFRIIAIYLNMTAEQLQGLI